MTTQLVPNAQRLTESVAECETVSVYEIVVGHAPALHEAVEHRLHRFFAHWSEAHFDRHSVGVVRIATGSVRGHPSHLGSEPAQGLLGSRETVNMDQKAKVANELMQ